MMKPFWKTHIPLLRTLVLLLIILLGIGFSLSSLQQKENSNLQLNRANWQWAPASSYDETRPPDGGWSNYNPDTDVATPMYWIRMPLPQRDWEDPHLMIMNAGSLKIVEENELIYTFLLTEKNNRINQAFHWTMVPISAPLASHVDLLIRYNAPNPITISVVIGNKSNLITQILYEDLDNLLLGALLIFSGFISLGLYTTQRDRLYLFFTLLAFTGGYASLVRNFLLQVIWDYPILGYLQDVCMPIGTYAFIGALEQVFRGIHSRTISFLRKTMLLQAIITTISAIIGPKWYSYSMIAFIPLFLIVFLSVYWTILSAYRSKKDLESIWVMAGFTSLAAIALIHMYKYVLVPYFAEWFSIHMVWVYRLPNDLLFWGLFTFVICLIRVIMYRYTAMNRRLTEFNKSLEDIVQTRIHQLQDRTKQLEVAHQHLGASMRENAEALAEAMILEERHRITGSIHDTVGHTLSATIIQLEAAKRLLSKDQHLAEEKLVTSQELVRRGLDDIRQSVRLLREDASYYDLSGAIGALIREKEQTSGCTIESQLDYPSASLSMLQKRILFQTLQEGLSFGIKYGHGPDNRFRFTIHRKQEMLHMQLIHLNQAYTPAEAGFGLNAMADHVARLGGTLTASSSSVGFVLNLDLPIMEADNWVRGDS